MGGVCDGCSPAHQRTLRIAPGNDALLPAYIYYIIREGKRGTPMPSWKVLDEDETWDLVAYVLSVADEAP